ncbi:MAG: hypothetical protein ACK496_12505 [Acidobacteriota bacterium]
MLTRAFFSMIILCVVTGIYTSSGPAQGTNSPVGLPDELEQNETMRDTLKRMQIKREESDFQKLVEKSVSIREGARKLAAELAEVTKGKEGAQPTLSRQHEKMLRDMEKFARQIRADAGASDDGEPEEVGGGLEEVVARLVSTSERLSESMTKTSRRVISLAVISASSEVIDLIREIRQRLR